VSVADVDLVSTAVSRTADGMELRLRSPWYRSLPLSSIDLELTVDGNDVAPERIRYCLNDRDYTLGELHERFDEFWFVLDPLRLRVDGIDPGEHEVRVRLGLRIPYLFDEETGDVLQLWPSQTTTVTVPERPQA